jgi:hypothetical protein
MSKSNTSVATMENLIAKAATLLQKVGEGVFDQRKRLMSYSARETRVKPVAAMQYNRFAVAR